MILFVDDDPTLRDIAQHNLSKAGLQVELAADGVEALERFDPTRHELVITDLQMPRMGGMELLEALLRLQPALPVLVVTAYGSVDNAVGAMKAGAWHFLEKPFSRDQLILSAKRALETARLRRDNARLSTVERPILGDSEPLKRTLALVDRVAQANAPVLILGESGTGKELIARRIHARSRRAQGPFVAVSCAAIPAELLEAELFGHQAGAFTGAREARLGRFRAADGGTLLLDEVGELPLPVQAKLLRVLQEGQVPVLGSDREQPVDLRVLAATHQDLDALVAAGSFREDLLFRLDVVRVELPPLRERPDDIPVLAQAFLDSFASHRLTLSPGAIRALKARRFPGNVRELRNLCERLAILATGQQVQEEELPPERRTPGPTSQSWLEHIPAGTSLIDIEAEVIRHFLEQADGNVSQAARALSVPRHILAYRIEKYGLEGD
ncbi:MAG: sigma-54 dependent transcriptional regulator [Myxococcota bacterium]|nr:sigma-54 dependent transcriptional regulator [Myxococcota bacterium]